MFATLHPVDLLIVVGYVVGTTLLGAWFGRSQKDTRTYFIGDRDVPWWLVLASIVATETSTVTFLSVPGLAYKGDLTFLQLAFGYVLGRVVIAWLLLPQYFRGEWFTAYQLLRQRFDPTVQRLASALFLLTRTIADGLRLFLTALLLQQFTGWDMYAAILATGLITLAYTFLGGMQAVVWTDLIQLIIYLLGAAVAAALILHQTPGGWDGFVAVGGAHDKFRLLNFAPALDQPYTLWAGVIGGAFVTMATHGADQIMVQRYLCSRSLTQARAALVASGVVVLFQFLLFLLIGVGLFVLEREGVLAVPAGTKADEVFGLFILGHMPVGVVGLVIAAVLAAAMSTLSSSLNSSANAAVTDFYRPLVPGRPEARYLSVSRWMTVAWGLAQVGVAVGALLLGSPQAIVEQVLTVAGFTTGMVLGLFVLGSLPQVVSSPAAVVGLAVGFLAVLTLWALTTLKIVAIAWPWYAPVGTLVTVGVALLVNLVAPRRT